MRQLSWVMLLCTTSTGITASDAGSGDSAAYSPYDPFPTGAAGCCAGQRLYYNTESWAGNKGMTPVKDAAGNWGGALVAMMREIENHSGIEIVMVEQAMCVNPLTPPGRGERALHCVLVATGESVPLARFTSLWDNYQAGKVGVANYEDLYVTTSWMETDTAALLMVRRKADWGMLQFLAPFDIPLWLALLAATVCVGLAIPSVIRDRDTLKPLGAGGASGVFTAAETRLEMLYFAVSMLVGGDDLEWTRNLSARFMRVGWLFLILISVSSYTANLGTPLAGSHEHSNSSQHALACGRPSFVSHVPAASFFTAQDFEIVGPQDMTALRGATVCLPEHLSGESELDTNRRNFGAGTTIAGLVGATMPEDWGNTRMRAGVAVPPKPLGEAYTGHWWEATQNATYTSALTGGVAQPISLQGTMYAMCT